MSQEDGKSLVSQVPNDEGETSLSTQDDIQEHLDLYLKVADRLKSADIASEITLCAVTYLLDKVTHSDDDPMRNLPS